MKIFGARVPDNLNLGLLPWLCFLGLQVLSTHNMLAVPGSCSLGAVLSLCRYHTLSTCCLQASFPSFCKLVNLCSSFEIQVTFFRKLPLMTLQTEFRAPKYSCCYPRSEKKSRSHPTYLLSISKYKKENPRNNEEFEIIGGLKLAVFPEHLAVPSNFNGPIIK